MCMFSKTFLFFGYIHSDVTNRQTRLTALDLISYCAAEDAGLGQVSNTKQFLHMSEEEIAAIAEVS